MRTSTRKLMGSAFVLFALLLVQSTALMAQSSTREDVDTLFSKSAADANGISSPIPLSNSLESTGSKPGLSLIGGQSDTPDIPDPEDAFTLSVSALNSSTMLVRFDILDCCYLYQKRMSFASVDPDIVLGTPTFSQGQIYEDAFFGETTIHRNSVEANIPILDNPSNNASMQIIVGYQGCSDAGVCYPPQEKTVTVSLMAIENSSSVAATTTPYKPSSSQAALVGSGTEARYISEQDQLSSRLATTGMMALPLFFGLGILLAFTPCVFPMVPILSGIITADKNITQRRAFLLSATYVVSMAATYALFGVLAAATGANLQVAFQHPAVLIGFSLLFVVLALSMFGLFELQVPAVLQQKLAAVSNRQASGRYFAVSIMGVLSALIVGPCVAAPLIGVLSYITMSGDLVLGGITLFVMGLGMGFPLLIIGTSAGRFLPKAGAWMNTVKAAFGVGLLAVAIWMLERVLAPAVTMSLWAALALSVAVFLRVGRPIERRVMPMLGKALGHGLTAYGVMILVGLASGGSDPLRPLQALTQQMTKGAVAVHPVFQPVSSTTALDRIIAASAQTGTPVMLDFYADWCVSCKELEKYTFADPAVAALMSEFTLVQADVTKNTADDKALLERFGLFGPPAILFFQPDGSESVAFRVMGFMKADQFAAVLKQVRQTTTTTLSLQTP